MSVEGIPVEGKGVGSSRVVFTSDEFGPHLSNKARLDAWHDVYTSAYGATDIEWHGEGEFAARSEFIPFGEAVAGSIDYMFHRVSRSSRQIAGDNREDLIIGFMRDAPVRAKLGNRELDAPAGSVFFYSTARPVEFQNELGRITGDTLVLPHTALAPVVRNLDDCVGRVLEQSDPAVSLLKRYVEIIVRQPADYDSPALKNHVRQTLVDLAAIAVGSGSESARLAGEQGQRAARLTAIKADIRDSIGWRDISVQAVAARHGITPRYLHVLFESEARTFSEFVNQERLARAHHFLINPRHRQRRISEIAFAAGFADLSTFNRQFRRRYGMTPSDLRATLGLG